MIIRKDSLQDFIKQYAITEAHEDYCVRSSKRSTEFGAEILLKNDGPLKAGDTLVFEIEDTLDVVRERVLVRLFFNVVAYDDHALKGHRTRIEVGLKVAATPSALEQT